MSDDPNAREEGFYWVVLGQNPPEIAYWERGEWWLAGDARPWQPAAVNVFSDKLVFRPRLTPTAGRDHARGSCTTGTVSRDRNGTESSIKSPGGSLVGNYRRILALLIQ